jgi:hypothetical protein
VPGKDLFFLSETDLLRFQEYLHDALIIPRSEFLKHSSYTSISLACSYEYWNISKECQYVIVAQPYWITALTPEAQKELFKLQINVKRGLIIPLSFFPNIEELPPEHIVTANEQSYVVLQKTMWDKLSYDIKAQVLKKYALEWDSWTSLEVPQQTPTHLIKYANTFSSKSGANCFASVLYAISNVPDKQEWLIHEWIHQGTFIEGLKKAQYQAIAEDDLLAGDVVTWLNEEGVIQHAAYHIGNHIFFNKNGQTFFNPWKVVHWKELNEEWKAYTIRIYRK